LVLISNEIKEEESHRKMEIDTCNLRVSKTVIEVRFYLLRMVDIDLTI